MKTYIEWNNINSMWNSGYIIVKLKGQIMENFSVDDHFEEEREYDVYELLDILKEKYKIDKVIIKETNWR